VDDPLKMHRPSSATAGQALRTALRGGRMAVREFRRFPPGAFRLTTEILHIPAHQVQALKVRAR
jgi:hypothetical protein